MSHLITATKVVEQNLLNVLPRHFGRWAITLEQHIYKVLSFMCEDYKGGYWEFYELSNKGFYMAPQELMQLPLEVISNGFQAIVSADAAGIISTLYAFNALSCSTEEDKFINSYYWLRDFACEHVEANKILAAID